MFVLFYGRKEGRDGGIKQWDKMSAIGDSEKKYKEALCTIFYNFSVNLKLHQNKYLKIYICSGCSLKSLLQKQKRNIGFPGPTPGKGQ